MQKNKWRNRLGLCLAMFMLLWGIMGTELLEASAASSMYYPMVDGFADKNTLKGIQGKMDATEYGISHTLFNLNMNDCIFPAEHSFVTKGYISPFVFEGQEYYFLLPDRYYRWIKNANQNNISVSMVFLLAYNCTESSYKNDYIFQPELYYNPAASTANYYAPATTQEASQIYRAFFSWICEECVKHQMHIDNFILGNEANVPNQWNYTGTTDPATNAAAYANAFYNMYSAVRQYTTLSRCSIAIDHTWQFNYDGQAIAAKDFLDRVIQNLNTKETDIDWCVSCHLYPAVLYETNIWTPTSHSGVVYNAKNDSAWFIDGNNLSIMTNYIKNRYGEQHRIMLTEQGFTDYCGEEWQAAALAYSYYAAMYDPMVDCFILNIADERAADSRLNFSLDGKLAGEIYRKIGTANTADQQWISSTVLPIMGYTSWDGLVPNYGQTVTRYTKPNPLLDIDEEQVSAFITRLYEKTLGRTPDEEGLEYWLENLRWSRTSGTTTAYGFFFSDEFQNKNYSDEEYIETLYEVMMDRASDPSGKAYWLEFLQGGVSRICIFNGFAQSPEFGEICTNFGIQRGEAVAVTGRDRNKQLTMFVSRLYTKALEREYDPDGLDYWCNRICDGVCTIDEASTDGFFHSEEFQAKNLNNEAYITTLYHTFFDREPDASGFAYWLYRLENGSYNRDAVLAGFSNSPEFAALKADFGL